MQPQYSASAPAPAYSQPLPPAAKSGAGLKILFVVLGVLAIIGMLFAGLVWYGWHKVKQTAASNGIDLNGITETQRGPARRLNACDLISKDEISQIVGIPIDRVEGGRPGVKSTCTFYSSAAPDQSVNAAGEAIRKLQESKGNTPEDQQKAMAELGKVVRGFSGSQANGFVVSIETDSDNAKGTMAAVKIAMLAMTGGMVDKTKENEMKMLREDIKGVGDEAIMGPLASLFVFRKGNVAVTIDGRALTGGRDMQIAIGKRIADRL
jgi:hypothetical protein